MHRATIGREIKRNALSRELYDAQEAHELAQTTQRMAVSFRNFEGLGSYSIREKTAEGISSGADFFQLEFYYRSKTFQFFSWSISTNSERIRYTENEKFEEVGLSLTIKDSPLFGRAQLTLFSSNYLNFWPFKDLCTHSSFLSTSLSTSNQVCDLDNTEWTRSTLPDFLPLSTDVCLSSSETLNVLFNHTSVLTEQAYQQRRTQPTFETQSPQPGISSIHVATRCKFYAADENNFEYGFSYPLHPSFMNYKKFPYYVFSEK